MTLVHDIAMDPRNPDFELQHGFDGSEIPGLESELLSTGEPRFVICFDYGTTYSGVAWSMTTPDGQTSSEVRIIDNWQGEISEKVQSQFTFSPAIPRWGNIKHADYVIRLSKLKFQPSKRLAALKELREATQDIRQVEARSRSDAHVQYPLHLAKSAPEIVMTYLTEVARNARRQIELDHTDNPRRLEEYPIDLVITHPAEWTYGACNQIFRAVNDAFTLAFYDYLDFESMGNIRLVSEPEACAQWTMKGAREEGIDRLQIGQCFTVVDAGGGTVDLVSYRVDQASPTFKFSKFTSVCGRKCGASYIDSNFLNVFLPRRLGQENFERVTKYDLSESGQYGQGSNVSLNKNLQELLRRFLPIKHNFKGPGDQPERLALSGNMQLPNDPARGIIDGQLLITSDDLVEMYKSSVKGTIGLIWDQHNQVMREGSQVKALLLSGGFSGSEYLYREIDKVARQSGFTVTRAKNMWSAAVRGGVLTGLGVGCEQPAPSIACPYNIGIVMAEPWRDYKHHESLKYTDTFAREARAENMINWLVDKGDLILPHEDVKVSRSIGRRFTRNSGKSGQLKVIILGHADKKDRPTHVPASGFGPGNQAFLRYDMDTLPAGVQPATTRGRNGAYDWLEMDLDLCVNQRSAELELVMGRVVDASGQMVVSGYRLSSHRVDFPSSGAES
ncbi:hypothetical protein B0T10DRAFT_490464 [Thelonectria olida]|uniref:Uncharacterized protein n=1 Tax=Thelonectria olida TaxID=1576542 RepID=A0A9P8W1G3_9HYPO|nr:hypothetical protein B0T10DRAFT_490464 [Thelonectria olida]